jgi:hypothetical protein
VHRPKESGQACDAVKGSMIGAKKDDLLESPLTMGKSSLDCDAQSTNFTED